MLTALARVGDDEHPAVLVETPAAPRTCVNSAAETDLILLSAEPWAMLPRMAEFMRRSPEYRHLVERSAELCRTALFAD